MAAPTVIAWRPPGWLRDHYSEHPGGEDRACWVDVIKGRKPVSLTERITVEEYEAASYAAWGTYILQVQCISRRRNRLGAVIEEARVSRVDTSGIRVVVAERDGSIRTCFYLHYPPYVHRSPSDVLPEELLEMFRQQLRNAVARQIEIDHQPPIDEIALRSSEQPPSDYVPDHPDRTR